MQNTIDDTPRPPCTQDEAFAYCARLTSSHYENFPVASLFLPEEKRPYIQAVYAFARTADDFADEGDRDAASRLRDLDAWEARLDACYEGKADHPIFMALAETVKKNRIPREYLVALLSAFRQDVVKQRYETWEELLDYCSRSANPVGRIVLHIFGHRDEERMLLSDRICTALQLTNFWQDLGPDRLRGRLYLPLSEMERVHYTVKEWEGGIFDQRLRRVLETLAGRTRELFQAGAALPGLVERDIHLEIKLVWLGGMTILRKIEKSGYDVIRFRPSLSRWEKIRIFLRGFWMRDISRFGRRKVRKEPWDLT